MSCHVSWNSATLTSLGWFAAGAPSRTTSKWETSTTKMRNSSQILHQPNRKWLPKKCSMLRKNKPPSKAPGRPTAQFFPSRWVRFFSSGQPGSGMKNTENSWVLSKSIWKNQEMNGNELPKNAINMALTLSTNKFPNFWPTSPWRAKFPSEISEATLWPMARPGPLGRHCGGVHRDILRLQRSPVPVFRAAEGILRLHWLINI